MNPAAILALIADLYVQIGHLQEENEQLREQLAQPSESSESPER